MNLDKFKEKLKETQSKLTPKYQAGGLFSLSRKKAAGIAQDYRNDPTAKFKSFYFLDSPYHQTYQNKPGTPQNTYVSKMNPGLSSEGMIVRDGATAGTGHQFTNEFLDQVFQKPVQINKQPMPQFKATAPAAKPMSDAKGKPMASGSSSMASNKPNPNKYSASKKKGGVLRDLESLKRFLNGKNSN